MKWGIAYLETETVLMMSFHRLHLFTIAIKNSKYQAVAINICRESN